jgi:hypothetical protein
MVVSQCTWYFPNLALCWQTLVYHSIPIDRGSYGGYRLLPPIGMEWYISVYTQWVG